MKHIFFSVIFLLGFSFSTIKAENVCKEVESLKTEVKNLKNAQELLSKQFSDLSSKYTKIKKQILDIQTKNKKLIFSLNSLRDKYNISIDSLRDDYNILVINQKTDKSELVNSIGKTNEQVDATKNELSSRTMWGACGLVTLLTAIIATIFAFLKKIKSGTTSIDDVRKAQEALQAAQTKMQEESVKLDNQLLAIVQKQLNASVPSANKTTGEPDHSLVVKLADEIARIETNLSKMDKSVRGYKQLVQAKDRMINNVRANGYEIISLLGQEYNDGMQFQTRFVPDESLPEGKRIITGMIKMQVNYNGKMIQPAEIVVSQNI